MSETSRLVLALLVTLAGGALLLIGSLVELLPNLYFGIELSVGGGVLIPVGFRGLSGVHSRAARIAVNSIGAGTGVTLFGVGVGLTGVTYLTVAVVVAFAGLALLATVILAAFSGTEMTHPKPPDSVRDPIPAGSGFCPFCGESILVGHAYCRKCGRPLGK
jgi:hypothetical protein